MLYVHFHLATSLYITTSSISIKFILFIILDCKVNYLPFSISIVHCYKNFCFSVSVSAKKVWASYKNLKWVLSLGWPVFPAHFKGQQTTANSYMSNTFHLWLALSNLRIFLDFVYFYLLFLQYLMICLLSLFNELIHAAINVISLTQFGFPFLSEYITMSFATVICNDNLSESTMQRLLSAG